jgi:hypothetical protein
VPPLNTAIKKGLNTIQTRTFQQELLALQRRPGLKFYERYFGADQPSLSGLSPFPSPIPGVETPG